MVSDDRDFLLLVTSGETQLPEIRVRSRVASLYFRSGGHIAEVARTSEPFESSELLSPKGSLNADASGIRTINIGGALQIEPGGAMKLVRESKVSTKSTTETFTGRIPAPSSSVTVSTGVSSLATPGPAVDLPASVLPIGWQVHQAIWSPDQKHLAVSMAGPGSSALSSFHQLSIYYLSPTGPREIFREVNYYVELTDSFVFKDINGDSSEEVVFRTGGFGNSWPIHGVVGVSLVADELVERLAFRSPGLHVDWTPTGPIDPNRDGVYEWLALDASWEYAGFCHACSPASWFVFAWNGESYEDASRRYAATIDAKRAEVKGMLDPMPPEGTAACWDMDVFLSASAGRYLDLAHTGRMTEANSIIDRLKAVPLDGPLAVKRDWIINALRQPYLVGSGPDAVWDICMK
jgi:hypothetical protein